jgi:hypothetical protein
MPRGASVQRADKQNLPGMADMGIPEIQQAAAGLLDVRSRRIALTKEEDESEQMVVKVMEKNSKDYYNHDGLEVSLTKGKTKAKVKHAESNGAGDE